MFLFKISLHIRSTDYTENKGKLNKLVQNSSKRKITISLNQNNIKYSSQITTNPKKIRSITSTITLANLEDFVKQKKCTNTLGSNVPCILKSFLFKIILKSKHFCFYIPTFRDKHIETVTSYLFSKVILIFLVTFKMFVKWVYCNFKWT